MTVEYMSSEESLSEPESLNHQEDDSSGSDLESSSKKVLCVKPLPWRSRELNVMMTSLDRKNARRRSQRGASMLIERRQGPPSTRAAPDDAPEFALSTSLWVLQSTLYILIKKIMKRFNNNEKKNENNSICFGILLLVIWSLIDL